MPTPMPTTARSRVINKILDDIVVGPVNTYGRAANQNCKVVKAVGESCPRFQIQFNWHSPDGMLVVTVVFDQPYDFMYNGPINITATTEFRKEAGLEPVPLPSQQGSYAVGIRYENYFVGILAVHGHKLFEM